MRESMSSFLKNKSALFVTVDLIFKDVLGVGALGILFFFGCSSCAFDPMHRAYLFCLYLTVLLKVLEKTGKIM